jgi:hypothetical protein
MKIDDSVRLDRAVPKATIPAAIECRSWRTAFRTLRNIWLRKPLGGLRGLDCGRLASRLAVIFVA